MSYRPPQRRRIATAFKIIHTALFSRPLLVCPQSLCFIGKFILRSLDSHSYMFVIVHSLNRMPRAIFRESRQCMTTGVDVAHPTPRPAGCVHHTVTQKVTGIKRNSTLQITGCINMLIFVFFIQMSLDRSPRLSVRSVRWGWHGSGEGGGDRGCQ